MGLTPQIGWYLLGLLLKGGAPLVQLARSLGTTGASKRWCGVFPKK